MDYISGETIRMLRQKQSLTQKQLGERLGVSEKTISKWETQKGLPDITLLEPLSRELRISVGELLSGKWNENLNKCANMKKSHFYICPICGNVIHSMGEGSYSCCGILLPEAIVEEQDEEHQIHVERLEDDYYITMNHVMLKEHFISFCCYVTSDTCYLKKLYPQQDMQLRFRISGHGYLYVFCNKHGLYRYLI